MELTKRLEALTRLAGAPRLDAHAVGDDALRILSQPRFAEAPAEGFWSRIQRRLVEWLLDAIDWLVAAVGGPLPAGILAFGIVAIVSVITALALGRRRTADILRVEAIRRILSHGADPGALELEAERASAAGDHSTAIRLRFVAGLLRLDRRGQIDFRAGLTTGEIGQSLGSPVFDGLMSTFDGVAYGRVEAAAADEQEAIRGWQELLR